MDRNDELCQFQVAFPDYGARIRPMVEHALNRGFKSLMNEIERVGREPHWETLQIRLEPSLVYGGLVLRGEIVATGPISMTREQIEADIQIKVQEP